MHDHALAWAARGFKVFPCVPGGKEPLVKEFYNVASADAKVVSAMWTDPITGWRQNHNIGVSTDDMIVVDIDMKNGKNGMVAYLALDLPLDTLMVKTPTGGYHAYFSGPSRSLSVGRLGAGLDIRSFHGYVVAPGSMLNGSVNGSYTVDSDCALRPAPETLIALLDAPRERHSAAPATDLDTEFALARAAKYLRDEAPVAVEGDDGDGTAYRIACIVRDMGLSQPAVLDVVIEHYLPRCAAPFSPAEQVDWFAVKIENAFTYALSAAGSQSPAVDLAGITVLEPRYLKPETADRRWQTHGTPLDLDAAWLFYEMLPQTGVGVLSGPSQGGKTFVLMHLAKALATGEPFFGVEPDDRGGSILLTGEGRRSVAARMEALGDYRTLPIVSGDISNLAAAGALDALAADLREQMACMRDLFGMPVRLVGIDTLSAAGLLRDENDNSEAGVAIKALMRLSEMLNVFIVVTHHPPKDGRGQRGAGAIFNDVDVVIEIIRETTNAIRELKVTKARDASQRSLGVFTLIPRELGRDSRGRAVTSCYVSDAPPTPRDVTKTPTHVELLLRSIEWRIVDGSDEIDGRACVEVDAVQSKFREDYEGSKDPSNFKKQWDRTLAWALESGAVEMLPHAGKKYLALPSFV